MSVEPFKNDEELLNYALTHSQTERALFHREHYSRIWDLAGMLNKQTKRESLPEWMSIHYETIKPIIDLAFKNLRRSKLTLVP